MKKSNAMNTNEVGSRNGQIIKWYKNYTPNGSGPNENAIKAIAVKLNVNVNNVKRVIKNQSKPSLQRNVKMKSIIENLTNKLKLST